MFTLVQGSKGPQVKRALVLVNCLPFQKSYPTLLTINFFYSMLSINPKHKFKVYFESWVSFMKCNFIKFLYIFSSFSQNLDLQVEWKIQEITRHPRK